MFPVLTPTEFPPLDATIIINALVQGLNGLDPSRRCRSRTRSSRCRVHTSTPYAITNPIWIDVDGNGWTPPEAAAADARASRRRLAPMSAQQFEALPEISSGATERQVLRCASAASGC